MLLLEAGCPKVLTCVGVLNVEIECLVGLQLAFGQGEGEREREEKKGEEPVGILEYFVYSSPIIYVPASC